MPVLAGLGPFGPWELALILLIVVLIFGVGRLPEVGGAVGKGIREFRKATNADDDDKKSSTLSSASNDNGASTVNGAVGAAPGATAASASDRAFCTECGAANARGAKFCAECGHAMTADIT
jgi:sec-independent protein translocase protein TatA